MSPALTPQRRRRSDASLSSGGNTSSRSDNSKRARSERQRDDDEEETIVRVDDPPGNDVPARLSTEALNGKHQPGAIVRVTLSDFVTYTQAEFLPGPSLNMVIGPNGTGKSTLVCAICIGMGWSTAHLGRAKDLGEFVKHGSESGQIEIELAKDPSRHRKNPVITTKITKKGNKAEYMIDGHRSTKKAVQQLARSFSIQVDNLCQFLPQDRVVEFAALNPVNLLVQTQRAAAPEQMTQWHEQLTQLRKDQKQKEERQVREAELLKTLENRQRVAEPDVERMRERAAHQDRLNAMTRLRPTVEYRVARTKYAEAKARSKGAQKELTRLERRLQPNLEAVNAKIEYGQRIEKLVKTRQNLVQKGGAAAKMSQDKIKALQEEIKKCEANMETEREQVKKTKSEIPSLRQQIHKLQRQIDNPPEEFDASTYNQAIWEKARQSRDIESQRTEKKELLDSLDAQFKQRTVTIDRATQEKASLSSQAGQQASKLRQASEGAAKGWAWIQRNKDRFKGDVFGPPIVECSIKNPRHASAIESVIGQSEMIAFTVTDLADYKELNAELFDRQHLKGINIRLSSQPLSAFQPPVPRGRLAQLGLDSWCVDLVEGPEPVLAMLCDNRNLSQTAFASRPVSDADVVSLQTAGISSWVTPQQTYNIVRRRDYGSGAASTRVNPVRQARFFTDTPVDRQAEQSLEARIREARGEQEELRTQSQALKNEIRELNGQLEPIAQSRKDLENEKSVKQRQMAEWNGLPIKKQRAQEKLDQSVADIRLNAHRRRELSNKADQLSLAKGQAALDFANSIEALRGLHQSLFEAEIVLIEAKSDEEQLHAQHETEAELLQQRRSELKEFEAVTADFLRQGQQLKAKCERLGTNLSDLEEALNEEMISWSIEQLDTELEAVHAQIELTHGDGNQNLVREFEQRAAEIEQKRTQVASLSVELDTFADQIRGIRDQWEPQLDKLVETISQRFGDNMGRIQCAGEVRVWKTDDFEQWAIHVYVKFRENEPLSLLDNHRQSGGERAVSTIFYLLSLQSLAQAPFRLVDEINQGMDPRNERLVHSRMVEIACEDYMGEVSDGHPVGCQYFLITPKLLQGLRYHPNMTVHCIASGQYMPEDHKKLDFAALAEQALDRHRTSLNNGTGEQVAPITAAQSLIGAVG